MLGGGLHGLAALRSWMTGVPGPWAEPATQFRGQALVPYQPPEFQTLPVALILNEMGRGCR